MSEKSIKITPLGGLGEIGLNCQLWESGDQAVMIDCGLMFPDTQLLGINALIPNLDAIRSNRDKLQGIVLTHGHEDHIGALPWILPELGHMKIYGSRFTLALVKHKLEEHGLVDHVDLIPVAANDAVEAGPFIFHFFAVRHSIPDGFGLGIETPVGRIIHSGDFKLEATNGDETGLNQFRSFAGEAGVRLLLSDSTNILRDGHSISEEAVQASLDRIFAASRGRIVVTLFSSHIQRIQEIFDLAEKYGRAVIISGKSLANNIEIASSLGYARLPKNFHNAYNGLPDIPQQKTVLLVTGAQGEPLSALSRMVWGDHRQLSITPDDTVIMSSRVIPGNARAISRLINEIYRIGAEVYYEDSHLVHASGHSCREELRMMLEAARPRLFIPIHGEFQHLVMHGRLAEECGVCPENVLRISDGQTALITPDDFKIISSTPMEHTLVDGKGVGDVGTTVLRERRILGDEGIVIVSLTLDKKNGKLLAGPEITSMGFVYAQHLNYVLEDAKCIILEELDLNSEPEILRDNIRSALRRFFRHLLDRDPIVAPIVTMV